MCFNDISDFENKNIIFTCIIPTDKYYVTNFYNYYFNPKYYSIGNIFTVYIGTKNRKKYIILTLDQEIINYSKLSDLSLDSLQEYFKRCENSIKETLYYCKKEEITAKIFEKYYYLEYLDFQ